MGGGGPHPHLEKRAARRGGASRGGGGRPALQKARGAAAIRGGGVRILKSARRGGASGGGGGGLRHTASTMVSLVPGLGSRKFATQVVYLSLASLGLVAANARLHASFTFYVRNPNLVRLFQNFFQKFCPKFFSGVRGSDLEKRAARRRVPGGGGGGPDLEKRAARRGGASREGGGASGS